MLIGEALFVELDIFLEDRLCLFSFNQVSSELHTRFYSVNELNIYEACRNISVKSVNHLNAIFLHLFSKIIQDSSVFLYLLA